MQAIGHRDLQRLLLGYEVIHPNATIKQYTVNRKKQQQWWAYFNVVLWEKWRQLYLLCCKAIVLLEACNDNKPTIARHKDATIKYFICCWLQGWWQWGYFITSYRKKQQQLWLIAMRERKIVPRNNQLNICVALQGSKRWSRRHKALAMKYIAKMTTSLTWWSTFYVICCIARSYDDNNISFGWSAGSNNEGWSQWVHKILQATTNLFHWFGSTTSAIAKTQGASNNNWLQCHDTMSTMQQSFFIVILQGATTMTDKCKGRAISLPGNNQIFMLSFAGCNDYHIAPRYDQQRKYAKVEFGEYAGKGVYVT
jgi:hypothetical protein